MNLVNMSSAYLHDYKSHFCSQKTAARCDFFLFNCADNMSCTLT